MKIKVTKVFKSENFHCHVHYKTNILTDQKDLNKRDPCYGKNPKKVLTRITPAMERTSKPCTDQNIFFIGMH